MMKIDLNGEWCLKSLSPDKQTAEYVAQVPGSALNDMIKADENKEYGDIFYRDNANHYLKYERYSWVYSKTFEVPSLDETAVLVFERLDTYCDVYLNNKHIAYCDNGNIEYSFDVSNAIKQGENVLQIYFYSPITLTDGKQKRAAAFTWERLYTRRTQCTYGWDWTMRFVTCGIGNVYLHLDKNRMSAKSAYVYTLDIDEESATIGIDIDVKNYDLGGYIDIEILDDNENTVYSAKKYSEEDFVRMYADIPSPKLWYPIGYGKPHLYTLNVYVDGILDYTTPFGIRNIKIMQLQDEVGSDNYNKCIELKKSAFSAEYDKNEKFSSFILKVNGIKIMCKGANWVPCVPFNNGSTDEKVSEILKTAANAGVNMIRVWGGGSFETSHFYDECSRLGILVTQDFLMACGSYPEKESWFTEQLKREAEYAVLHLRNKACLAWWSGDNENAVDGCDTDKDYKGRAAAYKAIAPVLYKKDFTRRFLPSSPLGGSKYASNTVGTTHNTQFLSSFFNYVEKDDLSDYKDVFKQYNARFIAEEVCFGAVKQSSLKKFMTEEDIFSDNDDMWKYHTKTNPGLKRELFEYLDMFTQKILGKYKDGVDRYFKLKYIQYEWIRVSLERTRREKWFCSGVIYWMLNDCWPAASGWSLIDYYVKPKAAYYSFKRAAKPVMLSIDFKKEKYKIYLCNDLCEEHLLKLKVYAVNINGEITDVLIKKDVSTKYNNSYVIAEFNGDSIDTNCFAVAEISDENGIVDRAFYKKGIMNICNCNDKLEVAFTNYKTVKLKAKSYIHTVELECDGTVADNYFSMMPNEELEIPYESAYEPEITAYNFS